MTVEQAQMVGEARASTSGGIAEFAADFRGEIVRPDDVGYEAARRVWNGMIDRHPALIARPDDAAGVASAIAFARGRGLPLAVRGGGIMSPGAPSATTGW